jgi:1,4-alpha-glucan branching enzyme
MAKSSKPKTRRVVFTVRADPGSKVYLAGSFNNWDPLTRELTDKKKNGIFTAMFYLPSGTYEYKFVINGTWCVDPECSEWVQNDMGTLNSVCRVE